jgi:hypothetical protein
VKSCMQSSLLLLMARALGLATHSAWVPIAKIRVRITVGNFHPSS